METVLGWQLLVALSVIVSRGFSAWSMVVVAFCWTAFTVFAVGTHQLILLQLGVIWGTVWLVSLVFGGSDRKSGTPVETGKAPDRGKRIVEVEPNSLELTAIETPSARVAPPRLSSHFLTGVTEVAKANDNAMIQLAKTAEEYAKRRRESLDANKDLRRQLKILRASVTSHLELSDQKKNG